MLEHALAFARRGLRVFPVVAGQKDPPRYKGWQASATTNEDVIRAWWSAEPHNNVGVLADDLLVVDVDVDEAGGVSGFRTLLTLPGELPTTLEQRTPRGGGHLVFRTSAEIGNRVKFRPGLDTRARGGYFVAAGSRTADGAYTIAVDAPIAEAPAWLVELVQTKHKATVRADASEHVDQSAAVRQARRYLMDLPIAFKGERNDLAYKAVCVIRDMGVSRDEALTLMDQDFLADPSLPFPEMQKVVNSAYERAQNAVGSSAPESDFAAQSAPPSEAPPPDAGDGQSATPGRSVDAALSWMNERFAYALTGTSGCILHFTKNAFGEKETVFRSMDAFTKYLANRLVQFPGAQRPKPLSEVWMSSLDRKTFDGVVFAPQETISPNFYNLWQGFSVEPYASLDEAPQIAKDALERYIEHTYQNVARSDERLYRYAMGFCAHAIQKPYEKPQVALVLRGHKGCGKDSWSDCVGNLFHAHYINTPKRRQIFGDFNSALEPCVFLSLNEAFWHGDAQANSVMQDLITGRRLLIERKGIEPYFARNLMRVVLIGNADTIVNASWDERRYQCFEVGDGRRGQPEWFEKLRLGMEAGGYRALLRFLLDWNLDGFNAREALKTEMLHDQKVEGLPPLLQWWRESLEEGRLLRHDVSNAWPERIDKEALRLAFRQYRKDRGISGWELQNMWIGRKLKECCPAIDTTQKRVEGSLRVNEYRIPPLGVARLQWDTFIGHTTRWDAQ